MVPERIYIGFLIPGELPVLGQGRGSESDARCDGVSQGYTMFLAVVLQVLN
jgi:hypothetical protein